MDKESKRVNVNLDEDLNLRFRQIASYKYKFEKGWFSKAINEAVLDWIKKNKDYELFNDKKLD